MLKVLLLAALLALAWWWFLGRRRSPARPMSLDEARAVLGVAPDADADMIRAAHRRLIAQVHPDAGGSADLARRVNLAREVLLAAVARRPEGE
ncbi:MAG: DnaJ domain-containing protein [Sphingomonadaceae bacterium]